MRFGADSTFTAVPGSTIHMTGSALENENTDPTDLLGLHSLEFIFEGGAEDIDPFEVAGQDMGAVIEGWTENFAHGTLTLGGDDIGQVQLVDSVDNQPVWEGSEALYVYTLNLGAGSYLDLNGHNLYYFQGSIDPGATILYNGGSLTQLSLLPGEVDGDGWVGADDLVHILTSWGLAGMGRAQGDCTGDGFVGADDYVAVLTNWATGTPPQPVPEPANLGMLLFGGLALLRRRK